MEITEGGSPGEVGWQVILPNGTVWHHGEGPMYENFCEPSGSTAPPEGPPQEGSEGEVKLEVKITVDNYPQETAFEVTGEGISSFSYQFTNDDEGTVEKVYSPVETGKNFMFKITDSYGDGNCCGYGQGDYKVSCIYPDGTSQMKVFGNSEWPNGAVYEAAFQC